MNMASNKKNIVFNPSGFTLVELLVVIAIIGVLAVVILVAINPVQQLARTRDAGRKSSITQLGHALEAYATTHAGVFVAESATWATDIVNAGELTVVPAPILYSITGITPCVTLAQNDYCYDATDVAGEAPIIAYTRLESTSEISLCPVPATDAAWFVWSTADGRGGTVCTVDSATEPTAGSQTFQN
jgi:prepilin-type N-terminal cleavage/methylation domain-containing protein